MSFSRKPEKPAQEPIVRHAAREVPVVVSPPEPSKPTERLLAGHEYRAAEFVSLEGRPRSIPGRGVRITVGDNVYGIRPDGETRIEVSITVSEKIIIPLSRFAWLKRAY